MKKAIFLDRDGVLNKTEVANGKPRPPKSLQDFSILPGVYEGLHLLKQEGFALITITNQPDVGRGTQQKTIVESMHRYLMENLPLDSIEVCYDEQSYRYKPNPGMLFEVADREGISLNKSYVIGDRWRDISAGKNAGCQSVLIDYQYGEHFPDTPDFITTSLYEAAKLIVESLEKKNE